MYCSPVLLKFGRHLFYRLGKRLKVHWLQVFTLAA